MVYSCLLYTSSEDGNIVMKSRLLTVKLDTKTGVLIYETRNGMEPKEYLFEGEKGGKYSERSVQLILKKALIKANVQSEGSVHTCLLYTSSTDTMRKDEQPWSMV